MKVSLIITFSIMLINLSVAAQLFTPSNLLLKPILINNDNSVAENFSVHGLQTNYWLENNIGEISMTVTTQDHLLVTASLYDEYDHEKTQSATLINNRAKNITLFLENLSPGNYRLVVTALATNHQISSKTFHMTLSNMTTEP
ncbi:TPA: hypothetical protein PXM28_003807 [Yersinia enterocolitica]|nr:hypothetical protein [Yersinia enterocolitica]